MTRTLINHSQVVNTGFISEAEGAAEFIFRDGYGTNNNLVLDGYVTIENTGLPAAPTGGKLSIYYHDGYLNSVDSYGARVAYSSGGATTSSLPDALSLELQYYLNNPSFYTEMSYNISNQVTDTDIWDSSSKTTHIFNKHLTWVGSQVTTVLITRLIDSKTLQKDLTYDGYGRIIHVNRTYTP
jgi:hypothetical protein